MSDFNSSLPIRTQTAGDVATKIVDGTITSQALSVDSSGKIIAKLNDGAGNNVTSQTNGSQQALDVGINVSGVQVDPRDIRALTSSDTVTAVQTTGSNLHVSADNFPTTVDVNFGAVGASTIRTAAEVGNATGAADFNNGSTGAQTLRVAANLAVAGADVTPSNPVPVTIEDSPGTHINDYKAASAIAAGASDNHDYTVTAGKTLHLNELESSGSGKAKMEVQVETGVATGVFNSYFVQFNSTANPNMRIVLSNPISIAAGVRVRLIMTNKDNQAQDLYSTICGYEV